MSYRSLSILVHLILSISDVTIYLCISLCLLVILFSITPLRPTFTKHFRRYTRPLQLSPNRVKAWFKMVEEFIFPPSLIKLERRIDNTNCLSWHLIAELRWKTKVSRNTINQHSNHCIYYFAHFKTQYFPTYFQIIQSF